METIERSDAGGVNGAAERAQPGRMTGPADVVELAEVAVLEDRDAAAALIDPLRGRILAELAQPGSATTVAAALGLTRQQVNYHVRALEACGLVTLVEERPRRGVTERVMRATARSYVVSPAVLGELAANPARLGDRLSARYLVALASRTVREVGALLTGAERAGKQLATLAIDTEIRFADAAQRAAFTEELAEAVRSLAARYHDESAPGGRPHRLIVTAYPTPSPALVDPESSTPPTPPRRGGRSTRSAAPAESTRSTTSKRTSKSTPSTTSGRTPKELS